MEPTDFTSLKTEVEAAKALAEADYTIATWKSFAGEIQEAEDILAKTDASQAEVNEALEHLQGAEKELQKVTVTLDKTAAAVYTGKTTTLKATTNDSDATVTFESGNTKVATVSSKGVVKGVKAGTAVITAKVGNATATCKVTVKASTIKFAKASVTIYKGKTATVKATATPSATVKYTSSNTKVATVNSKTGVVKGIKAGTVTITAKAGALKTTCKVVVKNPAFSLVKSSATIKKGKTTTIRSKATPAGKVTYTSSNKKVAAVNSKGVVKGIKKGKATITVKCNGITKKFVVTVK
jgi:bacterial surface proteins containing Ig-like domains